MGEKGGGGGITYQGDQIDNGRKGGGGGEFRGFGKRGGGGVAFTQLIA